MLPADVGELVPATPAGVRGEKLIEPAAARGARSVRARISRRPAQPLLGNISRTAEFIGMERSALHRKLKSLAIEV